MGYKRGNVWIIPNKIENIDDIFCKDVLIGEDHNQKVIEYINKLNLPLTISLEDYHLGPCELAELGYMVVKSEINSSLLIFYIPKIVSKAQLEWFLSNQYMFLSFIKIGGYSLNEDWTPIKGIQNIRLELVRKHKLEKDNQLKM